MDHAVLLVACPRCHAECLELDTGQTLPECSECVGVTWTVSAAWTAAAAPWWEILSGRAVAVESARDFLWHLRWCIMREHPSGPIGAKITHIGMQLIQATAPNGDTTWHFTRTAGSEN